MASLMLIAIGSALCSNVVLSQFLGICSFLGVSKKTETAAGMGGAVVFVITIASFVAGLLYKFILVPTHFEYLKTIVFILEMCIRDRSWGRVENPKKVFNVGDKVTVLIKDINGDKIALSLKFPEENPWLTAAEDFAVGNVVKGKVARMTDFGAFVELAPGVDALLHVSQISREHVAKPSDVLSIGQELSLIHI